MTPTASARPLKKVRQEQALMAIWRDGGFCAICYFRHGRERPFAQVHHVYGRSRDPECFREAYTSLLCVCLECHPPPIQFPGGNYDLAYVESALKEANRCPINPYFPRGYD